jgi:hypothetical protein
MVNLVIISELIVCFAGFILMLYVIRHLSQERFFRPFGIWLLLFLLLNAAALALLFVQELLPRLIILQAIGFSFLASLGASAWAAKPLMVTAANRRWMSIGGLATVIFLAVLHAKSGLFQLLEENGKILAIALNSGGEYALAAVIVGGVLLLGKSELLTRALAWRYGKRGATIAFTLILSILSVIAFSSVSLVYGRISNTFWAGSQLLFALLFLALISALRHAPVAKAGYEVSPIRITQFVSSGALIYGGIYLIVVGLLVKIAIVLGGDWRLFVSSFAALGAIFLAFVLITGKSLRDRWTRFVERNLLAGRYDFRRELQNLTEAISTATDRGQLLQAVCHTMTEIFMTERCGLLIADDESSSFQIFGVDENKQLESNAVALSLSKSQVIWLERVNQSFEVERLLSVRDNKDGGSDLNNFLITGGYKLGSALYAGRHLLGAMFLGPKRVGEFYSEEDKQLVDMLANAISLSIHGSNLQRKVIESMQMASIYRITSFIMHDLRNAVTTLTLLTHNAEAHLGKKTFRADFIAALTRVSNEMQSLIHKLSSVKTGGQSQRYEQCDPAELILDVLEDIKVPANIELKVDVAPLPMAFWDKSQIRVVLRNIILNGIEAMPDGGELKIQGKHDRSQIQITVSDTGVGMSEDFIRRCLFKPNQTTKSKGLGIGLYQSRGIVSAHNGKIQVESWPGEGTTFDIILPCMTDNVVSENETPIQASESTIPVELAYSQSSRFQALVYV